MFQLKIIYFTAQLNHKHLFYSVYGEECLKLCNLTCFTASWAGISDTMLRYQLAEPRQIELVFFREMQHLRQNALIAVAAAVTLLPQMSRNKGVSLNQQTSKSIRVEYPFLGRCSRCSSRAFSMISSSPTPALQNLQGLPTELRLVQTVPVKVFMAVRQVCPFTPFTFLSLGSVLSSLNCSGTSYPRDSALQALPVEAFRLQHNPSCQLLHPSTGNVWCPTTMLYCSAAI